MSPFVWSDHPAKVSAACPYTCCIWKLVFIFLIKRFVPLRIFHLVHIKTHCSSVSIAERLTEEIHGFCSVHAGIENAFLLTNIRPSSVENFVATKKESSLSVLLNKTTLPSEGCCIYFILDTLV